MPYLLAQRSCNPSFELSLWTEPLCHVIVTGGGERAGCHEFLVLLSSPCNFVVDFHVRRRLDHDAGLSYLSYLSHRRTRHSPHPPPFRLPRRLSPASLQPPFVPTFHRTLPHPIPYRPTVLSPPLGPLFLSLSLSPPTHSVSTALRVLVSSPRSLAPTPLDPARHLHFPVSC